MRAEVNFSHLYSTRPEISVDDDFAAIQALFRDLVKKGKTGVTLINYYHGLPLSFPARIVGCEHGMLDLDIHPQQAIAIEQDQYTFVRCSAFKHDICAKIQYSNAKKHAATLTGFFYIEILAERRNAIRLRLPSPIAASIGWNETLHTHGRLFDLSVNGLAIETGEAPECENGLETRVQFVLPNLLQNTLSDIILPARYVGMTDGEKIHLCRFVISADKQLEQLISKYIFQRQVELIQALRDAAF
jgi:hypothetical protein